MKIHKDVMRSTSSKRLLYIIISGTSPPLLQKDSNPDSLGEAMVIQCGPHGSRNRAPVNVSSRARRFGVKFCDENPLISDVFCLRYEIVRH